MESEEAIGESEVQRRVGANLLLPGELKVDDSRLHALANNEAAPFNLEARAFLANLRGVGSTLSIPHAMASHAILMREHFRIDMLVRIESGLHVEDLSSSPETMARIRRETDKQFFEYVREPENKARIHHETLEVMDSYLDAPETKDGAPELLRQAIVLCWTAFEVLARDVFIKYLNRNPQAAESLLNDRSSKRKFDMPKISITTLAEHGFDLSSKMGSLFAAQQDLSDIVSIKVTYGALFNDMPLRKALASSDLRLLSKRRNLIVHRCGAVDQLYLKETSDPQTENERLRVEISDVVRHVESTKTAAFHLLDAASAMVEALGVNNGEAS